MSGNVKNTVKWSAVSSLLVALLGFLGSEIYFKVKEKMELLDRIDKELILQRAKSETDSTQWAVIKDLDTQVQLNKVEVMVSMRLVEKFIDESLSKEIVIKINEQSYDNGSMSSLPKPPKKGISDLKNAIKQIEEQRIEPIIDYQQRQEMRLELQK